MTDFMDWKEKWDVQVHVGQWVHQEWLDFKEMLVGMVLMDSTEPRELKVIFNY